MYQIDWSKYLATSRCRNSESIIGTDEQKRHKDARNAFDSDFGRVIFSTSARRMHDKTQVFPLTSGDYVHTRLTHSLEVMNIAQSMGWAYCRNEEFVSLYKEEAFDLEREITAILKTAAFVHDIGNPPFGHYGEDTIQNYFMQGNGKKYVDDMQESFVYDFTQFDGNAQGFRVLSKMQYLGDLSGLNLTHATLGAYLKYPNIGKKDRGGYVGMHKHGVFKSEEETFNQVVAACGLKSEKYIKRHPLAFIVEAADTICYLSMDLEDGLSIGITTLRKVIDYVDNHIGEKGRLKKILNFSWNQDMEPTRKDIVNFRVKLIQYFVDVAMNAYITNLDKIDKGEYKKELLEDDPNNLAKILGDFERKHIFSCPRIVQAELTGESVLMGLLDKTLELLSRDEKRIKSLISRSGMELVLHEKGLFKPGDQELKIEELDVYSKVRLAIDWISGMTDKYALETYQKLSGMKL